MSDRGSNARDRSGNRVESRPKRRLSNQGEDSGQRDLDQGTDSGTPRCVICSYKQEYPNNPTSVHHRHFSSANLCELLGVEQSGLGHFCPSCKSRHRPYLDDRLNVVVSDSTMHDV